MDKRKNQSRKNFTIGVVALSIGRVSWA